MLNPAGFAKVRRPKASIGLVVGLPKFAESPPLWWDTNRDGIVNTSDEPLNWDVQVDPHIGAQIELARHVGGKFGLGLVAYVPAQRLIRFKTFEPALPNWFMYENRQQRYVAVAGLGGTVLPGLSIGASVDVLAKARFNLGATLDARIVPPEDGSEAGLEDIVEVGIDVHDLNLELVPALAPIFGIQWELGPIVPVLDGLALGASVHLPVGLPISADLDIQANVTAEDIGDLEPFTTAAIVQAQLALFDHYQPLRVQAGVGYQRKDLLSAYVDVRWTDWRRMTLNVTRVEDALVTAPFVTLDDAVVDRNPLNVELSSTVGLRGGYEMMTPKFSFPGRLQYVRLTGRLGGGYEPTPLRSQGPESALLDANRGFITAGAGLSHWDPFKLVDGEIRWDLFFQYHIIGTGVLERDTDEPKAGYPVDYTGIPYGGNIVAFGGQFGFDY